MDKVLKLVGGGSVINGASPSSFKPIETFFFVSEGYELMFYLAMTRQTMMFPAVSVRPMKR